MARRVVIAGGSGLIGRALSADLLGAGFEVVVLTRAPAPRRLSPPGLGWAVWDGRTVGAWRRECEGAAAVVHLAGENLASGRWSAARKRRLVASRVEPAQALVAAIADCERRPTVYLQASGVSLYDPRSESPADEAAPAGSGFLADLVRTWEEASRPVEAHGVRRVLARSGVVLARGGGALPRMLPAFRWGLGGLLGSGRQGFPWIHWADEVAALRFLLADPQQSGAFNLVAPQTATNAEFSRALAAALSRPCRWRVPALALRLAFGEMAEVLLSGPRAVPGRLLAAGFQFRFPSLSGALGDLVDGG